MIYLLRCECCLEIVFGGRSSGRARCSFATSFRLCLVTSATGQVNYKSLVYVSRYFI